MRLLVLIVAVFCWPFSLWHTLAARRRLRTYAVRSSAGRLTLQRVA